MKFVVSPEDFLRGGLVEPGWHPAEIIEWNEDARAGATAKNPNSQLTKVQFRVLAGSNKGAIVYTQFSEITPAFLVPLIEAVTGQTFDKKKQVSFETSSALMKGKRVDIHVTRGSYNNKPNNQVDGYKKYTGPTVTTDVGSSVATSL